MRRRRLIAIVLTLLMVLAMSTAAFAADGETTLNDSGEAGAFTTPDKPNTQGKKLMLQKEFVVYNVDGSAVNLPTITYAYTIDAATVSDITVTDAANKHNPEGSVTAPVKPGESGATVSNLVLAPSDDKTWNSGTDGVSNFETITVDFGSVVFTGAGVYRYVVTEKLASGFSYATSGVTESTETSVEGARKRYIDVYVRPAEGYTDGTKAADWDIYGYTCFYNNTNITDDNKTTVPVKTTGFVAGTTDGTNDTAFVADRYYTFNLTLRKTVVGDAYGATNVTFPFTVVFTNTTATRDFHIIASPEAADKGVVTIPNASVVVGLKSGETATFTGIPCGTSVEVYETNVATGVTYKVSTVLTKSTTSEEPRVDDQVTHGDAPTNAVAQADSKPAYQSTKATFSTNANEDTDVQYKVDITNTFVAISPTGVILRYAPYMLVLVGGLLLLGFGWKLLRRSRDEEETA